MKGTTPALIGILMPLVMVAAGCKAVVPEPTEPPLSSDDVIRTAEAIVELTRQAATPTVSPTPITPTPTEALETPTPTATETPAVPIATANYNANVRSGPDETYAVIDFFLEGETAEIIGRYAHPTLGMWYYIRRLGQGLNGWVWGGAVSVAGDLGNVPFMEAPPTETPTPQPTSPPAPTATPTPSETPED